ncbi:MAG: hypothetical protein WCX46_02615 [Candidatus Paceibacterota bacterium]
MNWALKRQLLYIAIIVAFFGVIGFLIIYPKLNKAPTCFDTKQNGDETGIDCGGSCALACTLQVDNLSTIWSRAFEVVPGRYNAVAYLKNSNVNTAINKINYRFRFADKDNVYIGKREGSTYVPPSANFAIFEPAIDMGNSMPVYTTFEFTEVPIWIQVPVEKINQLKVFISNIKLENTDTNPNLSATIKNNSLFQIPEVNVIAILYDATGNAVSASRTYLDSLIGEESANINFTWIQPFAEEVIAKEIIPIFNIFSVKLE